MKWHTGADSTLLQLSDEFGAIGWRSVFRLQAEGITGADRVRRGPAGLVGIWNQVDLPDPPFVVWRRCEARIWRSASHFPACTSPPRWRDCTIGHVVI